MGGFIFDIFPRAVVISVFVYSVLVVTMAIIIVVVVVDDGGSSGGRIDVRVRRRLYQFQDQVLRKGLRDAVSIAAGLKERFH